MTPKVTIFVHGLAPNPIKIAILLEELNVEYHAIKKELGDGPNGLKAPDFLKINPNGRIPALIDHTNNDHIVWESGAILLYIAERFDPTRRFIGITLEERSQVWEWLFFQVSGLGPTQGQVGWFRNYHPIKPGDMHPSVLERIYGVLEKRLEKEEGWLALKRFTIADIAHYPWLFLAEKQGLSLNEFPKLAAYCEKIKVIPSVERAYAKVT
ncbi:glutathione S-transferase family protein [Ramaria rubella]|nr:glutathione S-transferase family protein [Ramaria rubella]